MNRQTLNGEGIAPRIKAAAGAVGAGALIGMGALTIVVGDGPRAHAQDPSGGADQTTTMTTAPSEIETPSATPSVTAEPYVPE